MYNVLFEVIVTYQKEESISMQMVKISNIAQFHAGVVPMLRVCTRAGSIAPVV